jgi:nucleolar complex protein 2
VLQVLASRLYQEGAFEETLKGILIYLSSACYSPAFPEIIFQVVTTLRQFAKATTVNRFRRQAKDLVDKLERNATWVKRARLAKGVAPGKGDLNCLRPSDNNVASGLAPLHQIYLQSSQQAGGGLKDLLEARNMSVKGGDKAQEDDDDDDDDDEEGGDESEDDDDDGDEDATKKDEPRWKQAKREKRARMRAEKKAAKRKAAGDGNQEQQPAKKKKATPAKKKTAARGEDHGEDQVEDLELSDDE